MNVVFLGRVIDLKSAFIVADLYFVLFNAFPDFISEHAIYGVITIFARLKLKHHIFSPAAFTICKLTSRCIVGHDAEHIAAFIIAESFGS